MTRKSNNQTVYNSLTQLNVLFFLLKKVKCAIWGAEYIESWAVFVVSSPVSLSKEAAGWFAVQRELAGAVAGHSDSHESQQDGHARHHRCLPALQHRLGCLSLKERAGVTSQEAATTSAGVSRHGGRAWQRVRGLPPGSGRRGVLQEATLVTQLPQPGHGLAIGEEAHG